MDTSNAERVLQMTNAVIFRVLREDARQEEDSDTLLRAIDDTGYPQDEDDTTRELSEKILYIADMMNAQLDEVVMKQLLENFSKKSFEKMTENFKARGGMKSWGGVATFICLSCKIATRLAKSRGIIDFIQIIGWTVDFVKENLVPWIMSAGGWVAVLGPRSTAKGWNTVVIFMFGVLTGSAIAYKLTKWH